MYKAKPIVNTQKIKKKEYKHTNKESSKHKKEKERNRNYKNSQQIINKHQ